MLWKTCRRSIEHWLGVATCLLLCASAALAASRGSPTLPTFDEVKKTVRQYFDQLPKKQSGVIISRSQVEQVLRRLDRIGWRVADQKAILDAVLPDNSYLVTQLRTSAGMKFAKQLAEVPQGFDRLERLSRLPRGRQNVRNLIRGPDGYLMIEYMTTTPYGKNLSKMLSKDPGGKDFTKTTGRIYTVEMLLDRLEESYTKATGGAAKKKQRGQKGP